MGNNNVHVILTAEADCLRTDVILTAETDSLPTDEKELLEDCGLVECHSSRSNDLSVHARIDSTGYVHLLWDPMEDDELTHAARGRTADALLKDLDSVALAIEGTDLSITEDNFVPTARCIQDTETRQLVARSSLQRLRYCVCHLHHEQVMKAPYRVRQFFAKVLKKVEHNRVDVIAGDANAAGYKYYKRQECQDLCNSSVAVLLREMQRAVNMDRRITRVF